MSAGTTSIRRPAAHDRVYVVDGAYHQTFGPREASTGDNHQATNAAAGVTHEIATPCVGCYGVES